MGKILHSVVRQRKALEESAATWELQRVNPGVRKSFTTTITQCLRTFAMLFKNISRNIFILPFHNLFVFTCFVISLLRVRPLFLTNSFILHNSYCFIHSYDPPFFVSAINYEFVILYLFPSQILHLHKLFIHSFFQKYFKFFLTLILPFYTSSIQAQLNSCFLPFN